MGMGQKWVVKGMGGSGPGGWSPNPKPLPRPNLMAQASYLVNSGLCIIQICVFRSMCKVIDLLPRRHLYMLPTTTTTTGCSSSHFVTFEDNRIGLIEPNPIRLVQPNTAAQCYKHVVRNACDSLTKALIRLC